MLIRKLFLTFANAVNYYVKGTCFHINTAGGVVEILEGASIATSGSGATVSIVTNEPHGLLVGETVRVIGHRNTATLSTTELIDPDNEYHVVTVPTSTTLTLNLTTSDNGAGGFIGRKTPDYIRSENLETVLVGGDLVEERVG